MYIEQTNDDYERDAANIASTFSSSDDYERCAMCGDRHHYDEFDSYKGQRMCLDCVEIERTNDAEKALAPNYAELFYPAV